MRAKSIIPALALSFALALPASAGIPADGEGIGGIYAGSYLCRDGEHGFFLAVDQMEPRDGEIFFEGRLGFFPVLAGMEGRSAHVAGSFEVFGYVRLDGEMSVAHHNWLVQPQGYGAADMQGRMSRRDDGLWQITGKPVVPGNEEHCSDLIATQFLP